MCGENNVVRCFQALLVSIKIHGHEYDLKVRYVCIYLGAVFRCLDTDMDLSSVGLGLLPGKYDEGS